MRRSLRLPMRRLGQTWPGLLPLFLLLATQALAAPPRAELLHGTSEGDWLLIIEADGERRGDELSLVPLLRQFAVGRVTLSRVTTPVHSLTRWQIPLHGVAEDARQVPALVLGAESTPALPLPARNPPGAASTVQARSPVELQASILHQGPLYPGQPFLYRLNLWLPANMEAPNLSEPVGDDFIIRRLGNDRWESPADPGMPGRLTRQWLLQAKKPGLHPLESPRLQGHIPGEGDSGDTLSARAATLFIKVDKSPQEPVASALNLSRQLIPAKEAKAGEPVILTLTLMMEGGDGNRLPMPPLNLPPGLQARPDGEQQQERFIAKGTLRFERQWRLALTAEAAGHYPLPALDLPWFNTRSGRIEHARLPAETLHFEASPSSSAAAPESRGESLYWAVGALLLRALWRHWPRWLAFWRLQCALTAGDPDAARRALLAWAGLRWHASYRHLAQVPCQRDPAIAVLLRDLDGACFAAASAAGGQSSWPTLATALCGRETIAMAYILRKLAQLSR